MRKLGLKTVGIVALVALAIGWSAAKRAKAAPQGFSSACTAYVPASWGDYKGGSQQTGLAFEDRQGTLRFLTSLPCGGVPLVALEVRRGSGN